MALALTANYRFIREEHMSRTSLLPKLVALLTLVFALTCIAPAAQNAPATPVTNVTGFWVFRMPTGDGNFREQFYDVKQEGETVTGEQVQDTRRLPISDG